MEKQTITLCISGQCNLRCRYCIAKIPQNQDYEAEFDFDAARAWLDTYYKKANVHISGGEPLMIDGLADEIQELINDGHDVTIFTNGTLLTNHPDLYNMPVNWQISHHYESGVSYEQFFENISVLPTERILVVRLFWGRDAEQNADAAEKRYTDAGYNFKWLNFKAGYRDYECEDKAAKHPNKRFLMIGLHGDVNNCSNPNHGVIGNTHDLTLDKSNFETFECKRSTGLCNCQAMQSAEIFTNLHKKMKEGKK